MANAGMSNLPDETPEETKKSTTQRRAAAPAQGAGQAAITEARAKLQGVTASLGRYMTPVDPVIALVVLALLATFAVPLLAAIRRSNNEDAAKTLMRNLVSMQGRFRDHGAKDGRHRFATSFFELAAAGILDGDAPPEGAELRRDGYVYRLGTPDDFDRHYFAIAEPERFGDTGEHSYYIDDTAKLRESPATAIGPVFKEIN